MTKSNISVKGFRWINGLRATKIQFDIYENKLMELFEAGKISVWDLNSALKKHNEKPKAKFTWRWEDDRGPED